MTRQQVIGILFILLISGSECNRVQNQITFNNRINDLSDSLTSLHTRLAEKAAVLNKDDSTKEHLKWVDWTSNFGNSVCPEDMGLADVVKRFAYKSEKLQRTADELESSGLLLGAVRGKMREFSMRATAMYECSSAEKTRPELDALVNDPDTGVNAQLTQVYNKLIKTLNQSSLTDWRPDESLGCSMDLKFDLTGGQGRPFGTSDMVAEFHKSFYGASCDVAAYQAKQSRGSGNILRRIDEKLKQMLAEIEDRNVEEVIEKTVQEAENEHPDGVASLLELDDAALTEVASVMFVTSAIVIGVVVAFFLLFLVVWGLSLRPR